VDPELERAAATSADDSATAAAHGDERDQLLTDYETAMLQYVRFMKKTDAGGMSAVAEYPQAYAQAQEAAQQTQAAGMIFLPPKWRGS
jgi:hypothetical protein